MQTLGEILLERAERQRLNIAQVTEKGLFANNYENRKLSRVR